MNYETRKIHKFLNAKRLIRITRIITKFERTNNGIVPWVRAIFYIEVRRDWVPSTLDKASIERLHDAREIRHRDDY